jgi:hypothetical protein
MIAIGIGLPNRQNGSSQCVANAVLGPPPLRALTGSGDGHCLDAATASAPDYTRYVVVRTIHQRR